MKYTLPLKSASPTTLPPLILARKSIPQTARHTVPLVSRQRGEHPLPTGIYRGHRQFPHYQKIYEDNVCGKISDERFATMSMAFEEEQRQIKAAIPDMEQYLETETDKSESLQRFIDKVKYVTQLTELTPEIVHEFIEKMVVSKPEYIDGKRHQSLGKLPYGIPPNVRFLFFQS
ncbi:MAG: DUF4368 domain-containing protein [Ruminococcus sp.]|nr:DUF4368 domain-containing protein [Ruminococcus sp.]